MLKNRLLLNDLLGRHPEIREIELLPPVVIAGLPRTGTTHLHNLLAAGPTFRTIPYWESVEPFPLPAELGVEPDPRKARMDAAVEFMNAAMPHFPLMHEMTTEHVHEEIQLLANDFSTMLFETLAHVPRWRDYYLSHDQTSSYEHLSLQLKALQFLRGGRRWLLKSPQHLEQLAVLDAVFPGVVVVFTHRDPVPVVLSMLAMLTYTARMHRTPVPVHEIAASWSDRLQLMLNALVRDRDLIPNGRSIDVHFDEFMTDELGCRRADLRTRRRAADGRGTRGDDRLPGRPPAWPVGQDRDVGRNVRTRRARPARPVRSLPRAVFSLTSTQAASGGAGASLGASPAGAASGAGGGGGGAGSPASGPGGGGSGAITLTRMGAGRPERRRRPAGTCGD